MISRWQVQSMIREMFGYGPDSSVEPYHWAIRPYHLPESRMFMAKDVHLATLYGSLSLFLNQDMRNPASCDSASPTSRIELYGQTILKYPEVEQVVEQ